MHNDRKNLLYSICIDEDGDKLYAKEGPPGFEREFFVSADQVVEFPIDMGVTGFAYQNNSICYINEFDQNHVQSEIRARAFSLGKNRITLFGQALFGKHFTNKFPYNRKIDNLMGMTTIDNIAFVSIEDECKADGLRSVGVL